jgi:hypothetical protein
VLFAPPVAVSPRPDDLIPIFIADNSVGEITLQWRHNTAALIYEARVAADRDFTDIIAENIIKPQRRAPSWTITDKQGFEPGKTYYWQVRVTQAATGEKGSGQWSEISSFTIAENKAKTTLNPPIAPDNKSTGPSKPVIPPPPAPSDNSSKAGSAAADIYLAIYAVTGLLAGILITILVIPLISRKRW